MHHRYDKCSLTISFHRPQWCNISLTQSIATNFRSHQFLYSEGHSGATSLSPSLMQQTLAHYSFIPKATVVQHLSHRIRCNKLLLLPIPYSEGHSGATSFSLTQSVATNFRSCQFLISKATVVQHPSHPV